MIEAKGEIMIDFIIGCICGSILAAVTILVMTPIYDNNKED